MKVESVVDTSITVCINYSADDAAIFGEDYILEVKDGQKCHSLPVKDDIMFTSMGYGLKKEVVSRGLLILRYYMVNYLRANIE
ncbi:MAG: hypothetical protein LBS02_07150 [Hungatella sp.]|jgi:hypothetical protein|nr:hypothetical protein [Hungatella sp.]